MFKEIIPLAGGLPKENVSRKKRGKPYHSQLDWDDNISSWSDKREGVS
jgi:hypothetical protein